LAGVLATKEKGHEKHERRWPVANHATEKGGFFAVDKRIWAEVCSLGLNEAVVYLVLANGTGRDNQTSTWSVQAVENTREYPEDEPGRPSMGLSREERSVR
jgi:hypothetical protein